MTPEPLDPFATYVHLHAGGAAVAATRTATFWRDLRSAPDDRIVGAVHGRDAGDLHPTEAEMHPHGDELLCLLSGSLDVVLEEPDGDRAVPLRAGQVFVVPRGAWHRLALREPGDLLFVTPATGTQIRDARGR